MNDRIFPYIIKYLTMISVIVGLILMFIGIGQKTVQFLEHYEISRFVTTFDFGRTLLTDIFAYLLYLLFDVDIRSVDSLFDYFMR